MRYFLGILTALTFLLVGCGPESKENPVSASGVGKAQVTVRTQPNGYTVEQNNIRQRLLQDNLPGSIKYLYIVSAYTGQVLLYSTVRGKVTSSSKRLTPSHVIPGSGFPIIFGNDQYYTDEVMEDDGTYGQSGQYFYWFDASGRYTQAHLYGGTFMLITSQPVTTKNVIMNLEVSQRPQ